MTDPVPARVVVGGGGFAGVACARKLAASKDFHVTLIDTNDYHQFQPLLYQVATSMLAARDIAYPLRKIAAEYEAFEAKRGEVVAIDPVARTVTTSTGETYAGDHIVLAAGSQPNFFGTPGAEHVFPLYSLDDADRLKTRIIQAFEEADKGHAYAARVLEKDGVELLLGTGVKAIGPGHVTSRTGRLSRRAASSGEAA